MSKKNQNTESNVEKWGKLEGRKFFKFNTETVRDRNDLLVHPYCYKKVDEKTIDGKQVITLRMNGQDEEREFDKEELYKHFDVKKPCALYCTEEEVGIVRDFLEKILRDKDKDYIRIFKENDISEIKIAIDSAIELLDKKK